jgi:PhzF family phenazine biosynthesis protein
MKIPIYQVDAFTSEIFSGNPAAVCLLNDWISDPILQAIAAENNLSETAFTVRKNNGYELRWFTPVTEVALCGHATLASAYVLYELQRWPEKTVCFQTRKSGRLVVEKKGDLFEMDFPSRPPTLKEQADSLFEILGAAPIKVFRSEEDILIELVSEQCVRDLKPNFNALAGLDCRGVIVTARGVKADFVSRFFAPAVGIAEDPVTGSSHCVLTPYWAGVLKKSRLHAIQVSRRGGELFCRAMGERVSIAGKAALYMEGTISI